MRFYRLFTVALLLSITGFSFALTPSTQDSLNSAVMTQTPSGINSPSENQSLWLTEQIILLNNKITTLESQLPNSQLQSTENRQTLAQFKDSLALIKTEQVKLQIAIEQSIVENSLQYEAQNERVSDLSTYTNMWGGVFTFLTIGIALVSILLGLKVKAETVEASKETVNQWIKDQQAKIVSDVSLKAENSIKSVAEEATVKLDKHIESAEISSQKLSQLSEEYKRTFKVHCDKWDELSKKMSDLSSRKNETDINSFKSNVEQNLADKPESEYTPQDWFDKSLTAYYVEDYHTAVSLLNRVIVDTRSTDELIARSLFNKGVIVSIFDTTEEWLNAVSLYSELITRFSNHTELSLQELVAQGLCNKGGALGQLNLREEAINIFDELVDCLLPHSEFIFQELILKALYNKAIELEKLERYQEAIATYDELIKRFIEHEKLSSHELLKKALVNAADISLACEQKEVTLKRVELAEERGKADVLGMAMMKFIRFLVADSSINDVVSKIGELPSDTDFIWGFDAIRDYLNALTGNKKLQAFAIVEFIEKHHDLETLKKQLADIGI